MKQQISKTVYQKLLSDIAGIYDAAMKDAGVALDQIFKMAYWAIGEKIVEVEQKGNLRAEYGAHLLEEISRDMTKTNRKGFSVPNLRRMRQFSQAFPIRSISNELTWSHYVLLSTIKDKKQRFAYEKKAIRRKWVVQALEDAMRKGKVETWSDEYPAKQLSSLKEEAKIIRLSVQRGIPYTYQVIAPDPRCIPSNREAFLVDMGFRVYRVVDVKGNHHPKPGDIIRGTPALEDERYALYEVKKSLVKSTRYTYAAYLKRVIDGDTLKVEVDLGFKLFKGQKLRLRRINTDELDTKRGQVAKEFVERTLNSVKVFVIKTYSTDVYDRYLADVFYLLGCDDPYRITAEGTLLNQELIDEGLADLWQQVDPQELAFIN